MTLVTNANCCHKTVVRRLVDFIETLCARCRTTIYVETKVAIDACHTSFSVSRSWKVLHGIFMAICTQIRCIFSIYILAYDGLHTRRMLVMAYGAAHIPLVMRTHLPVSYTEMGTTVAVPT